MNSDDFWRQFEGAPSIDRVKMKHDIQAKIHEKIKDMSTEERIVFFPQGSEEFRREMAQRKALNSGLIVREEPSEYGKKLPNTGRRQKIRGAIAKNSR